MNFDDTPEEAAFRAEVRAWLDANATLKTEADAARPSLTDAHSPAEAEHVRRCKDWQRTLYDGGWAGITWPKEYGGRGGTSMQQQIFNQEQARYDAPTGIFAVGIGMTGPTLIAHGNDDQKRRYLDPLLRGEEVWCQLFSEPGAGSDLAGLSTRAERDGDEFVINGQKVWTSGAHYSDFGILLARTDPDQPKHRGITYFLVDMRTPGVDVRPLRQITGAAHFNEVFLTDVRIPAENVVGEVNQGWRVAMTTLTSERSLIGGGVRRVGFPDLLRLARQFGRTDDALVRQALATAYTRLEILKYLGWRAQTATSRGVAPGPEVSVLKLGHSRHMATFFDIALALQGPLGAVAHDHGHEGGQWQEQFLGQWSSRIGGGTDEVQRNIIGERVLGLPREPSVDRDVPFRQTARG